jgi:hypothetical protein
MVPDIRSLPLHLAPLATNATHANYHRPLPRYPLAEIAYPSRHFIPDRPASLSDWSIIEIGQI